MKKVLVILIVTCMLVSTAYAKDVIDSGFANFVPEYAWQYFDNRNNSADIDPPYGIFNTSKGEYSVLDVMIQIPQTVPSGMTTGLGNLDDIIEVTARSSAYPYMTFPLLEWESCNFLQNGWRNYYLLFRYTPWMHTSTWTYTLKYRDSRGRIHAQSFTRTGATNWLKIPPILDTDIVYDSQNKLLSWRTAPGPYAYKLRIFDLQGCIVDEFKQGDSEFVGISADGLYVSFNVNGLEGRVVRAERRYMVTAPAYGLQTGQYGLSARADYLYKIPAN